MPPSARRPEAGELVMTAAAFKARSAHLLQALQQGRLKRITLTKRGKPVATVEGIKPAAARFEDLWGCMAGTITVEPGVDPTAPAVDGEWEDELLREWDELNT